jgi:DNA-binding SARP family transcriptional activator
MAPPIPGIRRPVQVPHRSASDVVAGILAVILLAALTIGVPIALVTTLGLPIPGKNPLSLLTQQVDWVALLRILSIIVWLAWIQLVVCVGVEIRAAIRGAGVPTRIPLAGGTQAAAHRLVTAALLLFAAGAALAPAFSSAATPAHNQHAATQMAPDRAGAQSLPRDPQPAQQVAPPSITAGPNVKKFYVVEPPEGRHHDSLWEIAERHLGDGRRYREIFEMNKDRVQPDGTKLTIASLIRPGWVLDMPRDAHGPGIQVANAAPAVPVPGGQAQTGPPGGSGSGSVTVTPGPGTSADGGGGTAVIPGPGGGREAAPEQQQQPGAPAVPYELSAASLLAAGVLTALGRRRREQLWRRAFGTRVRQPEDEAALAEAALRLGANEPAVQMLDTGLRYLSQALAAEGRTPPAVFAAHIGARELDLWVAPADKAAPEPWRAIENGQIWQLPMSAVGTLDPDQAGAALAPYPGLVSIGTNEGGRILVDLEVAHGLISVRGPSRIVRAALAAIAVELATNSWSDRMNITLVGFGTELTMLAPERVTAVRTLDDALPALEARAAELEQARTESGVDSVLTGRSHGIHPEAWAPHYVIMAVPPTPEQAERLLQLARTRHRMAAGYVVAGDVPGSTWTWDVTEDGRLRAGVLGFDLKAELLPEDQYAAMVGLFRSATLPEGVALGDPPPDSAPPGQLDPQASFPVEVRLLGQVEVEAPGPSDPHRRALDEELVAYLAAHPEGVHPGVLAGALWPRGVTGDVRDAVIRRAAAWLGTDVGGHPNLITDSGGRLRLGPQARVDWQVFRALVARAGMAGDDGERASLLDRALSLVRGPLMDGREPSRYVWLATSGLEAEAGARVADAAHRLAELRMSSGDAAGAMEAIRAGLRLAGSDELLWRDLLRAAGATGREDVLRQVIGELSARVALDPLLPRMAPETEALIDELLPSWRTSVA